MADISITINSEERLFNLLAQEGRKLWNVTEEPIVPIANAYETPGFENLPPERILTWSSDDFSGGMGQWKQEDTDRYALGEGIHTMHRHLAFLRPQVIDHTTQASGWSGSILFKNREYFAAGDGKIFRLSTDKLSYEQVYTIAVPFACFGTYDGYLLVCSVGLNYAYSATGDVGSWVYNETNGVEAHGFLSIPPFEGSKSVLVAFKRPNIIRTTLDCVNGPWSLPSYIGDTGDNITTIFGNNGKLLIGKGDGLYWLPADGVPISYLPEFQNKRSASNFKHMTQWQSGLYFSLAEDIGELTSNLEFDIMGPIGKADGELSLNGICIGLSSDLNYIYALMKEGTNYNIYAGRERRTLRYGLRWDWQMLLTITDQPTIFKVMQREGENAKLWFNHGIYLSYIVLSSNPLLDTNCTFVLGNGYLTTSWYDANYSVWNKLFYKLWVKARKLVQSKQYIHVYYQTEQSDEDEWVEIAEVHEDGVSMFDFTPVQAKFIRLKFVLTTTEVASTPVLEQFILRGILQPESTRVLDFVVALEQSSTRKPSDDLSFLRGAREVEYPILIKDLRLGTIWYTTFLPSTPVEMETTDPVKKQTMFGARIRAQEISWKP
jgi:hypothetical protein